MNVNQNFYITEKLRSKVHQYKTLLNEIICNGHEKDTVQQVKAITLLAPKPMRFQLDCGIPLITERNLMVKSKGEPYLWQQSIAEIIAYMNGAHTLEQLEDFGCFWWNKWATKKKCDRFGLPTGDLGFGFYGNAFRNFPEIDGGTFDQISEVIAQIKNHPITRTHFISPWIPQYLIGTHRRTTITPCLGWMYFEVYDGKISLSMTQRAGDAPIGVPFNSFQYAVLLLMVAQVTQLKPHEFVHSIIDAHIYKNQMFAVNTMLSREDRKFPLIKINPNKTNLFDFRIDDFTLEEYDPHPAINDIPVNDV